MGRLDEAYHEAQADLNRAVESLAALEDYARTEDEAEQFSEITEQARLAVDLIEAVELD